MNNCLLISATQLGEDVFWRASYLGRSLKCIPTSLRPKIHIVFENIGHSVSGLSEIYNEAIDKASENTNLVFIHDDVYLHDWFIAERVREGLEQFDVIGVAGSTNPDLTQPSWGLAFDGNLQPDGWQENIRRSGAVNHFDYMCPNLSNYGHLSNYGPVPQQCRLLDGVFLSARAERLQAEGVRFDSQFAFHCYDLDFCRTAHEKDLQIGTWPISLTHNSTGAFTSAAFREAARRYLDKWSRMR